MTWYADLGHSCMAGAGDDVRAVGWLSGKRPYPTGGVAPAFVEALRSHLISPWEPFHINGLHECDLCGWWRRSTRGPVRESRNLYVPTRECVYIAPAMVLHYVIGHSYRPPDEFIEAIQHCPQQETPEYMALIAPFRSPFDSWVFDRAWEAKREAAHKRSQQWVRRGMCPRCEFWQYLFEGDVAAHCGVPLVRLEERDPVELAKVRSSEPPGG